jgi:hypothetical protein
MLVFRSLKLQQSALSKVQSSLAQRLLQGLEALAFYLAH